MPAAAMPLPPDYLVEIDDLQAHCWRVTLTVPQPAAEQLLSLPVWIPGSYMVREFARHLSGLQARQGRRQLAVEQLDKARWRVRCSGRGALVLRWRVYAFDASVRSSWLDEQRGFFNGTSLLLRVEGQTDRPHTLRLGALPAGWEVATSLPEDGQGGYRAEHYDALVDHPVELGRFWRGRFEAAGVPHELVVAGAWPRFDGARLLADARRICEQQIDFWHGHRRPPFTRYLFLLNAVEDGYGGLEHRASTALMASRRDLPVQGDAATPGEGYATLLGLISHEYFHAWNVKRLKPAELLHIDYSRENPSRLLWFFEGFTSYYDDLLLRRAGLIDEARYLKLLAKTLNAVAATPGRLQHSVAQASYDAWIRYYRPDENSANSSVSYYQKGALVALALDLTLRLAGGSLDAAMRALWQRGGQSLGLGADDEGERPISEHDIVEVLQAQAGRPLDREIAAWVHGCDELPLAQLLPQFGVQLVDEPAPRAAALGLKLSEGPVSGVQVKAVRAGSAAAQAGLSAGDELLAVDGWRIRKLDEAQAWTGGDSAFDLLLVRGQRVLTRRVQPLTPQADPAQRQLRLQADERADDAAQTRRRAWLGS